VGISDLLDLDRVPGQLKMLPEAVVERVSEFDGGVWECVSVKWKHAINA
jgi:hypothetical protein